jgi:putative toxin-antitoxin system antitoxin component (TIGR02293 family)
MAQMAALRTTSLAAALGGRRVLKADLASTRDLLRGVDAGLPYGALEAVTARFGLSRSEIAAALRLPLRTLARRKRERKLHPDESDRLVRVARVATEAVRILGSDAKASHWLHRANTALGGEIPIELLRSDLGAKQVENVLGRIEFGVYS